MFLEVTSLVGTDEVLLEWLWDTGRGIFFHDRDWAEPPLVSDSDEEDAKLLAWWGDVGEDSNRVAVLGEAIGEYTVWWAEPGEPMGAKKLCRGTECEGDPWDSGTIRLPTGLKAELGDRIPAGKALGEFELSG